MTISLNHLKHFKTALFFFPVNFDLFTPVWKKILHHENFSQLQNASKWCWSSTSLSWLAPTFFKCLAWFWNSDRWLLAFLPRTVADCGRKQIRPISSIGNVVKDNDWRLIRLDMIKCWIYLNSSSISLWLIQTNQRGSAQHSWLNWLS